MTKWIWAVTILLTSWSAQAMAGNVALTFDDVPVFGADTSRAQAAQITNRLLSSFRRHNWQVTGFVNEVQLEGPLRRQRTALLAHWLDAGMDLGNHTYSHLSLTRTPLADYIADVARGDTVTRRLLKARGRKERWFRHPYLETGPTPEIRTHFEEWLTSRGYRVAPVSMENSDWEFAGPYDQALVHGHRRKAAYIRRAYLAFTRDVIPWYKHAAFQVLGREPAFVMLLHASRLNASCIGALDRILRSNDLRPVSLDWAIQDPAYRIVDTYAGPDGDEWVTRWAMALQKEVGSPDIPQVPADIAALDAKIAADDPDPQALPSTTP